jgi:ABC-type transporter Mla maintaining outer membrane lipid asymmetry ATPase subunit MlaF
MGRYPGTGALRRGMGEAAMVVRGLRKRFGAQEAVAGIDLDVTAGWCAGLVGPVAGHSRQSGRCRDRLER